MNWIDCARRLPPAEGMYLVTCEYLDNGVRFTDVSLWQDRWEITAPGNDYIRPFKVVAWAAFPGPWREMKTPQ